MRSNSRLLIATIATGGLLGIVVAWSLTGKPSRPSRPSLATADATTRLRVTRATESIPAIVSAAAAESPEAATQPSSAALTPTQPSTPTTSASSSIESPPDAGGARNVAELERDHIFETLAWTIPTDAKQAEESCTIGNAQACLGLGERHRASNQVPSEALRSQGYFERAFSILVFKCNRREPDACATIARMHQLGRGIPQNTKAATTLLSHARELCRYKPGTVCTNFSK